MRIIIESDEKPTPALVPTAPEPSHTEATNAGPPAASLFQATSARVETGTFREGIDAGGPPASLVQALQSAVSPTEDSASGDGDAGAAPKR